MKFQKQEASWSFQFYCIKTGELFEYDSVIYMKIEEVITEDGIINAVDLATGEVTTFYPQNMVFKASANPTIEVFK